ncbi:hypothetical protein ONS95_012312 [Cadophora gregata]|uniref:uncharacterized protein n=1 Tax=Cadophora gregata TaxID=51156 RepID=UPI0026DD9F0D|nr:uncharacterized protein ONS95_012312 [Cadophora gregata]KAK0118001.1 hypothetical protein ONS95_012312 [Cadophora gregata]KAK0123067.1 hypothetical protein ONS96_010075 [Cadophora gregata f. sp. sojae]
MLAYVVPENSQKTIKSRINAFNKSDPRKLQIQPLTWEEHFRQFDEGELIIGLGSDDGEDYYEDDERPEPFVKRQRQNKTQTQSIRKSSETTHKQALSQISLCTDYLPHISKSVAAADNISCVRTCASDVGYPIPVFFPQFSSRIPDMCPQNLAECLETGGDDYDF